MSAHTPGPWHVGAGNATEHEPIVFDRHGWAIAELPYIARRGNEEPVANARLIAAAPELLAALQEMMEATQPMQAAFAVERARAAIAKATRGYP